VRPSPAPRSRPARALLQWLAVAGVATVVATALAALPDGRDARAQTTGDPQQGSVLYQLHCAACHAPDGRGGLVPGTRDPVPPLIGSDRVTLPYARLTLRTGRMPPAADPTDNRPRSAVLGPQAQDDVLAFMVARFNLQGAVADPGRGDPARGLELYATNCAQCHGASGAGGVAGGGAWTPVITGFDSQTVADAVRVGPFEMPRFAEEQLTDADVADVAAFLHTVGTEHGTVVGLPELNPVFASGFAGALTFVILVMVWVVAGRPFWFRSEPRPDPADDAGGHG
jgi:ubiquinol-cytochrome c reductase cytochrome c subunit